MIGYVLKKSIDVLTKKPIMLWGVSLLSGLIIGLVNIFGAAFPLVTIPIVITLEAGMAALYLDGYNGHEVNAKQLFRGFTKECFPRVPAGMCWYQLWVLIWAFVPIAGIVKAYSYRFTPYILLTRPEISAMDALKLSMKETKGCRLKMFLTDILIAVAVVVLILLLVLIGLIPVLGSVVCVLGIVAIVVFLPLFSGIVAAAFYQEKQNGSFDAPAYGYYNPPYRTPGGFGPDQGENSAQSGPNADADGASFCVKCGAQNAANSKFCTACGNPLQNS